MGQSAFSLIDTQYIRSLCEHLDDQIVSSEESIAPRFAPLPAIPPAPQPSRPTDDQPSPRVQLPTAAASAQREGLDEDTDPSAALAKYDRARDALHTLKSILGATGQLRIVERLHQSVDTLLDATNSSASFLADDSGLSLLDTDVDEEYIIMGTTLWSSVYDWHLDERVYGHYAVIQTQREDHVLHLFCFSVDVGRFILGFVAPEVFETALFKALSQALDAPVLTTQQLETQPA